VPCRLFHGRALFLEALLIAFPSGSIAQRYAPYGGWHGGYPGSHYAYGGYYHRPYYGYVVYRPYRPYYPYYGGYYRYPVWGMLGVMIAPPPVYVYPVPPPPPVAPPIQHCPDGSAIPIGSYCAAPPAAPAPAPVPAPVPQPAPERG